MATPSEKLAASLEQLHVLQQKGIVAIKSQMLSRIHRERLLKQNFIREVYKGWYIIVPPEAPVGSSTVWYSNYWNFCSQNLDNKFGDDWCLSPEQSIMLHVGNKTIPTQLIVRTGKGINQIIQFLHNTSLAVARASIPDEKYRAVVDGIIVYSLPLAIIASSEYIYRSNPIDMRTALSLVRHASDLLEILLNEGKSTIAGRLAGAFRNIGKENIADEIVDTMKKAGYDIREVDPFETRLSILEGNLPRSPYEMRIRIMWETMREKVLPFFPQPGELPKDVDEYLKEVNGIYLTDAYHSLSIEKYSVTPELIEKVKNGSWNAADNAEDKNQRNAMAAKGYWDTFQAVLKSIKRILSGENPGIVIDKDHSFWYRELFGPIVNAGIIKPADLSGYRNQQVYIDGSLHTPPNREAVRDAMPMLFQLIKNENEACIRAVLGHFVFVYIHPYMDGNGRIGRFIMNSMLASGGYPWTVIPVEERKSYMSALENASVGGDIEPFAEFIADLVIQGMKGKPVASIQKT